MNKLTFALCVLTLSSTVTYAATPSTPNKLVGNAEAGKAKSDTVCIACHGPDGNSNSATPLWPKIAGQHENYIVQQIKAFKAGTRQDPNMAPMVAPLTDQEIADMAAYFSSQAKQIGKASSEELAAAGQKVYRGGNKKTGLPACSGCHGLMGTGNPAANYPTINGQQVDYTKKQLTDYQSGARGKDGKGFIMQEIAAKMSPAEVQAVAEYITGLH